MSLLMSRFRNYSKKEPVVIWNQLTDKHSGTFTSNLNLKGTIYQVNFRTTHKYAFFFDLTSDNASAKCSLYPGFWNSNNSIYIRESMGYTYRIGTKVLIRKGISGSESFAGGNRKVDTDNLATMFQFINATDTMTASNCFCVDLTTLFGAGNEKADSVTLSKIRDYAMSHPSFTAGIEVPYSEIFGG